MAIRRYLTSYPPAFVPTLKGGWETSAAVVHRTAGLRETPQLTVSQAEVSSSTTFDMALLCVGVKLDFSGTFAVNDIIALRFGRIANTATSFVGYFGYMWISQGATNTLRGTAIQSAGVVGGASITTANSASNIAQTVGTAVTVTAGDYLFVELGVRATTASTTSRTASLIYGGLGPDLPGPGTGEAFTNETFWIEFTGACEACFARLPEPGTPMMIAV